MVGLGFFVSIVGGLVVSVTLARRFNLPAMIGYLIVGILLSGILKISLADANVLKELAEFGIALLLFTMGLEFSLEKLRAIQRLVFQVGLTQVLLVAVLTFCLCFVILHLSWQSSLLMSFMFSMSSTAIVGKMLVERGVVHSAHGYEVLGIALFQDIAIVPMLIILSALGESGSSLAVTIALAMAKSVFVLAVVLRWGRPVMHKWFDIVSRGQSHELFLLNIFFVSMGLSYLMIFMNLPMELGAFLAGMLLSDTEYQCQVEEDISPFRDILLGIFFVTLGMNLDLSILLHNFPIVLAIVITLMVLKGIVTALVSYIFSRDLLTASKTGVWLCSAGEFSFVMLAIGQSTSLVDPDLEKILIVSMVLSMILVTILIQYSHRFMDANFRVAINIRENYLAGIIEKSQSQNKHVIVIGFGQHGQFICRVFEEESVPYTVIDINEDVVRSANTYSGLVIHGEPSIDLLQAVGLDRASALVIAFPGCAEARRIIEDVRKHNEEIPIVSRVSLMIDISRILEAGASEVVPEVLETSLLLLTHAMTFSGLPMFRVRKMVNRVRAKNYALIYSFFGGYSGDGEEPLSWWQCSLPEGSPSIGLSLDELGFFKGGISVRSIQRGTDRIMSPEKDFRLQANDVMIVLGPEKNRADYIDKGFLIDV